MPHDVGDGFRGDPERSHLHGRRQLRRQRRQRVLEDADAVAAPVGLLFQQPRDQLFERTVEREVRFGLGRDGLAADQAVQRALAAVGLDHLAGRHPAELPASQQRLLALATVLARRPSVLALDEPTVSLDGPGLDRLDRVVRSTTADGTAVVLVTHDLDYARSIAHRLVCLEAGRLRGI